MSNLATVYVFIDANTALHFKRPDQVDWLKLTDAGEVVLVATPILLKELEEQKIINNSRKLRERAAKYIKWLDKFVDAPGTEVRSKVTCLFLPDEPQIDFGAERLTETISDDQLIASVLCYSRQSGARPIVATADIGLKVKLKSRRIEVLILPDDLRLPVEQDPIERENEDLRNKIRRLESRMPSLSITFEDGAEYHALRIQEPNFTNIKSLEQIKEEHPYETTDEKTGRSSSAIKEFSIELKSRENSRYNLELNKYFRNYRVYLDQCADWQEIMCMHHWIKIDIGNVGTAPASNVDVELYFPEGVIPVDKDDIPEEPEPPIAPEKNLGIFGSYLMGNRNLNVLGSGMEQFRRLTARMQSEPYIDLDENTICISYLKLKHGFRKVCDPLIFRFVSRDTEKSFKINYRLSANELPDAVEGNLHIRIDDDSNE
ncbi:MAG: hypothetical protein OXG54_03935 [Gammaproteobacteria bacterium]|nr:hypothetical protein [Gammaproteobacteria bacterium]